MILNEYPYGFKLETKAGLFFIPYAVSMTNF